MSDTAQRDSLEPVRFQDHVTQLWRKVSQLIVTSPVSFVEAGMVIDAGAFFPQRKDAPAWHEWLEPVVRELHNNPPNYAILPTHERQQRARLVLLVVWILTEPDNLRMLVAPTITRLQAWRWGEFLLDFLPEGDGQSPSRQWACKTMLELNLDWWVAQTKSAIKECGIVAPTPFSTAIMELIHAAACMQDDLRTLQKLTYRAIIFNNQMSDHDPASEIAAVDKDLQAESLNLRNWYKRVQSDAFEPSHPIDGTPPGEWRHAALLEADELVELLGCKWHGTMYAVWNDEKDAECVRLLERLNKRERQAAYAVPVEQYAPDASTQSAAPLIPSAPQAPPVVEVKADTKSKKKRGKPLSSDPNKDRRLFEAWCTDRYLTYLDLANAKNIPTKDVRLAIGRHRARERRAHQHHS